MVLWLFDMEAQGHMLMMGLWLQISYTPSQIWRRVWKWGPRCFPANCSVVLWLQSWGGDWVLCSVFSYSFIFTIHPPPTFYCEKFRICREVVRIVQWIPIYQPLTRLHSPHFSLFTLLHNQPSLHSSIQPRLWYISKEVINMGALPLPCTSARVSLARV